MNEDKEKRKVFYEPPMIHSRFISNPHQESVRTNTINRAATPPDKLPAFSVAMTTPQRPEEAPAVPSRKWNSFPSSSVRPTDGRRATYDKVVIVKPDSGLDEERHTYHEILVQKVPPGDMTTRLQNLEQNQAHLSKQFAEFKTNISMEIFSLKEITTDLATFMRESSNKIDSNLEKIYSQMLENSDHLGKQVMDVRRDIAASSQKQTSLSNPQALSIYVHSFEWELVSFENMRKNQREVTSAAFSIDQINCKISAGAACTKHDRLRLKLFGVMANNSKPSSAKFDCCVYVVDKSDKKPNWFVGKVHGDFTAGSEWVFGDVSNSEIKKNGFVAPSGSVYLKCVIEMCL